MRASPCPAAAAADAAVTGERSDGDDAGDDDDDDDEADDRADDEDWG
jgi:hypothetical protein